MKNIYCFLILIFSLFAAQISFSQNVAQLDIVNTEEFLKMDAPQKSLLIKQWNNASLQNIIPPDIENEALAYYKQNGIDERIYRKYSIFFKTITNTQLPVVNRINVCHFIIENYEAGIFPISLTEKILAQLKSSAK